LPIHTEGGVIRSVEKTTNHHFLSFIIPCFNCAATIYQAIESIYQQKLDIPFEVICTDDCSTDTTKEILLEYQNQYSNFHVCFHDQNKGGAAARNTCAINSTGDLIFCLDSDNILPPTSINRLVKYFNNSGCKAACFKELRYFYKSIQNHIFSWYFEAPDNVCDISHIISTHITPAASGNYLYTRESYELAGGYPEESGAMDAWGFGFLQHATGTSIAILPGSFYWHRVSVNSYWRREEKAGKNNKNAVTIVRKFAHIFDKESREKLFSKEAEDHFFEMIKKQEIHLVERVDFEQKT
jgi:glycosyltransferase involved in cell wall biosynthesis